MSIEKRPIKISDQLDLIKEIVFDVSKILKLDRAATEVAQEPEYVSNLPKLRDLYEHVALWHGTGRYKYSESGEVIDVLKGIIQKGGLIPHKDGWDRKTGTRDIISTAPSRMYARLYAAMFMPNGGRIQNELGSRELWGYRFLVPLGIAAVREYGLTLGQLLRRDISSAVSDVAHSRKWTQKISKEKHSVKDLFLNGTDIENNYPILIGIKKDVVHPIVASQAIDLYERRAGEPILFDGVNHIEVPRDRVEETVSLLNEAGHADIPVLPIEYGEEYSRGFSAWRLKSGEPLEYRHHTSNPDNKIHVATGERYESRQVSESCDDFRLADGRLLWYAFLENPDALVLKAHEANEAHSELRELFRIEPDFVRECAGLSIEEVAVKLRSAL